MINAHTLPVLLLFADVFDITFLSCVTFSRSKHAKSWSGPALWGLTLLPAADHRHPFGIPGADPEPKLMLATGVAAMLNNNHTLSGGRPALLIVGVVLDLGHWGGGCTYIPSEVTW